MKNISPIQWIIFCFLSVTTVILPFTVSSSLLFPFITGKNFLFRIIVEICLGLWVIDCIKNKEVRPKKSPLIFSIIGFVVVIGIADMLGVDPYRSFWSNYERMEGWVTLVHLLGFFLVLGHSLTEKMWYRLVQISLGTSFIVGIHALREVSVTTRIDGNFGNSTYLGAYAMIHVFFALLLLLRNIYEQRKGDSFWMKVSFYSILALFNTVILYFTGTRSAFLGLIAGTVVVDFIYIFTEKKHKVLRNISIGIISLVIVVILTLGIIKDTEYAKKHSTIARFGALATLDIKGYAETAGKARFMVWGMALEGVKERPLLGWGQENFPQVFSKYYNPGMFEQEQWFDRTHNVFLDWLIAGGILGLLSYLAIFAVALFTVWFRSVEMSGVEKGIITGIIVAYFVHNIFVFDNLTSWILIFMVLSFAHIKGSSEISISKSKLADNAYYLIVGMVSILVVYIIFAFNYASYRSSKDIIMGISYARLGSEGTADQGLYLQKSYDYFKSSIDRRTLGSREAGEQLSPIVNQVLASKVQDGLKNKFIELANSRLKDEALREPLDARSNLFYGLYLLNIGKRDEGISFLEKAHELSPSKQTILFPLASAYKLQGNIASSTASFKVAYELDKSFIEPKINYINSLIESNFSKEGMKLLSEIPENDLVNSKYINLLINIKRYDLVVKIFEKMVQDNPGNNQYRISLAAAYLQNGDRSKAITTIEEVAKVLPEFRAQASYLVGEIKAGRNPIDK